MGKSFGFAKSKYIERFIQETKLKPEVFGLEHVESMISKWIPQDANASEIVCKNAMQLKGKTLRVQQSLHKILKEMIPFYTSFGWNNSTDQKIE